MERTQWYKGLIISLFLGIIFFVVNFMSHTAPVSTIIFKSVLVALTFGVLYTLTFTLLASEQRRIQYGAPLVIGVALGALVGMKVEQPIICTLIGIVVALLIGYVYGRIKGGR
ncbi:hypothetical protein TP70_04190 [Staphylococcus microti]|uniref:Uncharacterized protein n=1 Tax=Staphylococcus microti TaxID=569857 RepID=A0A0D6XQP4_9STAP|nr:hypothetical protein [Staphylococcus microti]KIX91149.1 hypothetical protein TP70_04190 [Staphylococcus microti]PNZ75734.1 hypothetical protein CD132_11845 [Staphylococcus microti]SUM58241.1 Uncharacterised protein [Staphylococcus microti]